MTLHRKSWWSHGDRVMKQSYLKLHWKSWSSRADRVIKRSDVKWHRKVGFRGADSVIKRLSQDDRVRKRQVMMIKKEAIGRDLTRGSRVVVGMGSGWEQLCTFIRRMRPRGGFQENTGWYVYYKGRNGERKFVKVYNGEPYLETSAKVGFHCERRHKVRCQYKGVPKRMTFITDGNHVLRYEGRRRSKYVI